MNSQGAVRPDAVRELINRYAAFKSAKQKDAQARVARLNASLEMFWPRLADAVAESKQREQREASRFNLIRLLDLHQLEKNHSKILAELLNPSGTHAQGSLFIETFLDLIACGRFKQYLTKALVDVRTEDPIMGSGRIDIIIRCFPHFILMVENKIKSNEGMNNEGQYQLEKYRNWLNTQTTYADRVLIFLTVHAEEASKASKAKSIGYLRDLRPWLTRCNDRIQAPRVRESVIQYTEMIEELRNLKRERPSGDQ